jgi:hypothetical protein
VNRPTIPVRVLLHDPETGFENTWDNDDLVNDDGTFDDFMWTEGNYSCDCNRSYFITDWGKVGPERLRAMADDEVGLCLNGPTILVRITHRDTGEILYQEFP